MVLVTGAGGQLGSVVLRRLTLAGRAALGLVSPTGARPVSGETLAVDLQDGEALAGAVRRASPRGIVHTAARSALGDCFRHPAAAAGVNVTATRVLVEVAAALRAGVVYTSTDLVFDGRTGGYDESAEAAPLSVYGRTKLEGERAVRAYERGLVVRLPLMYGLPAAPRTTTFVQQLRTLRDGGELALFRDEYRSPLSLDDAAAILIGLVDGDRAGLVHAAGPERLSRLEMGRIMAAATGVQRPNIRAASQGDVAFDEPRPADVSLRCERLARWWPEAPRRPMGEAVAEAARIFVAGSEVLPSR